MGSETAVGVKQPVSVLIMDGVGKSFLEAPGAILAVSVQGEKSYLYFECPCAAFFDDAFDGLLACLLR